MWLESEGFQYETSQSNQAVHHVGKPTVVIVGGEKENGEEMIDFWRI